MNDTEALQRPLNVRVRCSPDVYRKFKGAFTMAGMTQHEALDEAFKNFAEAMLRELNKPGQVPDSEANT